MRRCGLKATASIVAMALLVSTGMPINVLAEEQGDSGSQMVSEESQVVHMVEDETPPDDYDYNQLLATVYNCDSCDWLAEEDCTTKIGDLYAGQQLHVLDVVNRNGKILFLVE